MHFEKIENFRKNLGKYFFENFSKKWFFRVFGVFDFFHDFWDFFQNFQIFFGKLFFLKNFRWNFLKIFDLISRRVLGVGWGDGYWGLQKLCSGSFALGFEWIWDVLGVDIREFDKISSVDRRKTQTRDSRDFGQILKIVITRRVLGVGRRYGDCGM